MGKYMLPYGHGTIEVEAPDSGYMGTYLPVREEQSPNEADLIKRALDCPIASRPVEELVKAGQKVVIIISDNTRPCPNEVLLPPLIERLNRAGVGDEDITIVVALGLHRKMTDQELEQAVSTEIYQRICVLNHDVDDVIPVGVTSRNTPVEVFRPVVAADVRICVGNVEFHYFAGFSGGAKAIIPGCASRKTVNANHGHMISDSAVAATLDGNPVREDLEEGVAMLGVDFIFNVVVNEQHQILAAASGDVTVAHRQLCKELSKSGLVPLPKAVDVAIVSAGGYPKDINLYQAQKALDNIATVVQPGGCLILFAQCGEGFGSGEFERWLTSGKTPDQLVFDIQEHFILGGHKAAAIAMVAQSIKVILVTEGDFGHKPLVGLDVFADPANALVQAFKEVGPKATYAIFPLGASTLPTT